MKRPVERGNFGRSSAAPAPAPRRASNARKFCVQHSETGLFLCVEEERDSYVAERNEAEGFATRKGAVEAAARWGCWGGITGWMSRR